jgi:uncharacterized membrane protein YcaP (DUF421 family)
MARAAGAPVCLFVFTSVSQWLDHTLGLSRQAHELGFGHMALRAIVVMTAAIVMVRIGARRFLGKNAAFDATLVVILGSVLSRAINGQAAFFPTIGVSFFLVLLHALVATAAFHSHRFSLLVKGRDRPLIRDGRVIEDELRRSKITYDDLLENLRMQGNVTSPEQVQEARLERNGSVSVVKRDK